MVNTACGVDPPSMILRLSSIAFQPTIMILMMRICRVVSVALVLISLQLFVSLSFALYRLRCTLKLEEDQKLGTHNNKQLLNRVHILSPIIGAMIGLLILNGKNNSLKNLYMHLDWLDVVFSHFFCHC